MEAEQQLIALGSELTPLRTPDEALAFLRAMGRFPPGTPARAQQIVRECRHPLLLDASHAQQLIDKLSKWRSWEKLAADLHRLHPLVSQSTIVLVPDVQTCVACGGERLASARHYTQSFHPTVITDSGVLTADLHNYVCGDCGALHNISYATGGTILGHTEKYYKGAATRRFFQSSPYVIYETKLLQRFEAQQVHSHTAAETFMAEYESLHGGGLAETARKRLSHAWLLLSLLDWLEEIGTPLDAVNTTSDAALDAVLLSYHDQLRALFIAKWGGEHDTQCRKPGRCNAYVLDGHMKCKRVVCANPSAELISQGTMGKMVRGCFRAPALGSAYCVECGKAASRRTDDGFVPEPVDFDFEMPDGPLAHEGRSVLPTSDDVSGLACGDEFILAGELSQAWLPTAAPLAAPQPAPPPAAAPPTPPAAPAAPPRDQRAREQQDPPLLNLPQHSFAVLPARPVTRAHGLLAAALAAAATASAQAEGDAQQGVEWAAEEEDEDEEPEAPEPSRRTWLVDRVRTHRKLTVAFTKARGARHDACVRLGKRALEVAWVDGCTTWECECDVRQARLEPTRTPRSTFVSRSTLTDLRTSPASGQSAGARRVRGRAARAAPQAAAHARGQ